MKSIKGNIVKLAPQFDVVIHGCNCFHKMGAGVAKYIAKEFPEALAADKKTIYGDRQKLGNYSYANIKRDNKEFIVVNAYTQYTYGSNRYRIQLDYTALRYVFRKIKNDFSIYDNIKLCYPKIGAGLASGKWEIIEKIIDKELEGMDHTLIVFD